MRLRTGIKFLARISAFCAICALCGCVSDANAQSSKAYYAVLGPLTDPIVVATAVAQQIAEPYERATVLLNISEQFIAREQYENAAIVIEDVVSVLAETAQYDQSFPLTASIDISRHDSTYVGSEIAANLYMDMAEQISLLGDEDLLQALITRALIELRLSPPAESHQQALKRFIDLCFDIGSSVEEHLERAIETALIYNNIVLRIDLINAIIARYTANQFLTASASLAQQLNIDLLKLNLNNFWETRVAYYLTQNNDNVVAVRYYQTYPQQMAETPPNSSHIALIGRYLLRYSRADFNQFLTQIVQYSEPYCALLTHAVSASPPPREINAYLSTINDCLSSISPIDYRASLAARVIPAAIINNSEFTQRIVTYANRGAITNQLRAHLAVGESYLAADNASESARSLRLLQFLYEDDIYSAQLATRYQRLFVAHREGDALFTALATIDNPIVTVQFLLYLSTQAPALRSPDTVRKIFTRYRT